MNWKQKIEAQINDCESWMVGPDGLIENLPEEKPDEWAKTMQALLDVAVAADEMTYADAVAGAETWGEMKQALDKLREVGDG
jgi:hypothetical protein